MITQKQLEFAIPVQMFVGPLSFLGTAIDSSVLFNSLTHLFSSSRWITPETSLQLQYRHENRVQKELTHGETWNNAGSNG